MANGKLKIDIRRARILELLKQEGQLSIASLSKTLGVTQTTLRTDLDRLAADGLLVRVSGGAIPMPETAAQTKAQISCAAEKTAIAKRVAAQIRDGDTLFLNSGTTTGLVAQMLREKNRLSVVTNSLSAAQTLGAVSGIRVVLLGGEINAEYGFTFGADAMEQLRRYQPSWAILSVDGVDAERGISTYHAEEAMIDRLMIQCAKKTILAADHRKIGRTGFSFVCSIFDGLRIVTDAACDKAACARLEQIGIPIALADFHE